MTEYVAGFLIDSTCTDVVLIRKMRPAWQAGLLNGVGGHIEPGEQPHHAMVREFKEETGLSVPKWSHFATVSGEAWGSVRFFRAFMGRPRLSEVQSPTDEHVDVYTIDEVLAGERACIPNLRWLLALARYHHDTYRPVLAQEMPL